jgi:Uma2 family endonuclease
VLGEIRQSLEFLFDDGKQNDADVQLARVDVLSRRKNWRHFSQTIPDPAPCEHWEYFKASPKIPRAVLVPDLAGWRRERMPKIPDTAPFELAPDWVAEVLSPSTEATDRTKKLPTYAREKVGHVWLLNPQSQVLEAVALELNGYRLLGAWHGDALVRVPPFEAVEIELGGLWAR